MGKLCTGWRTRSDVGCRLQMFKMGTHSVLTDVQKLKAKRDRLMGISGRHSSRKRVWETISQKIEMITNFRYANILILLSVEIYTISVSGA